MNFKKLSKSFSEIQYRELAIPSYSLMSDYERNGIRALFKQRDEETDSLLFGSAVDCLLTEGREMFESKFACTEVKISGKQKEIIDAIAEYHIDDKSESIDDTTIDDWDKAFCQTQFYPNRSYKSKFSMFLNDEGKIKEEYAEYYRLKQMSRTKKILNKEMYDDVLRTVNELKYNKLTGPYFSDSIEGSIEKYYQLKFVETINNRQYKCMVDLLIVDHENKRIIPIDLKTTSKEEYEFPESFLQWRYDIQARLYYRLINCAIIHSKEFCNYTVENYRFIVINKKNLQPLIWIFPQTKEIGNLINNNTVYRDPIEIGEEIYRIFESGRQLPENISTDKPNILKLF